MKQVRNVVEWDKALNANRTGTILVSIQRAQGKDGAWREIRIYQDFEWYEFLVSPMIPWAEDEEIENKTYHTEDWQDATATATAMLDHWTKTGGI